MIYDFMAGDDFGSSALLMSQYGPLLPVEIAIPQSLTDLYAKNQKPIPAPVSGYALIDTGATVTCIHEDVMTRLKIKPIDVQDVNTPGGSAIPRNLYPVQLRIPSHGVDIALPKILSVDLTGQVTREGEQVLGLIGRDFLQNCVLVYNGRTGMYSLGS